MSKFNTVLEDVVADDRHSHVMKVEVQQTGTNFDRCGNLTPMGKIEFWKHFDEQIKEFDRGKLELLPSKVCKGLQQCHAHEEQGRHSSEINSSRFKWFCPDSTRK